ncbi:MAG: chorismate mutase [Chloroflexaceae bacterium]|nr:chorismate mutase [Chloroflexaceae bacterium]
MTVSTQVISLARCLAGEFDNREQALANPAWYVHLRLWQRPVALFAEDSLTLFAEQASVVSDRPYRPRLLRLREIQGELQVHYYMFKDLAAYRGAGSRPELLRSLTLEQIEWLPDCTLGVAREDAPEKTFRSSPLADSPCRFSYEGNTYQVFLGFAATDRQLQVFDKGINPQTGQAIWGALMGPYCYEKRVDFSDQLPI